MPRNRTRRRRSRLQIGPTSRTRDSVWFLFPWRDFDASTDISKFIRQPTSHFQTSPVSRAFDTNGSVRPEKVFEANIVQTGFCFFATAPSGSHEFIIDRDGRFPLCIFFQQSRSIKSGFVIPEQLATLTGLRFVLQNFVECREGCGSI